MSTNERYLGSPRITQAIREIKSTYGDDVSVAAKGKSLLKFGKSASLVADTKETVWTVGGDETYLDDNLITHVVSSSVSDTQSVILEGHTVSGTGTDQKFTFVVQEVTLNGQTPVALATPLARNSRAYNQSSTNLLGRVSFYEGTSAVSGGVPSSAEKIHLDIVAGDQGTHKAATTFSDSDYGILSLAFGSLSKKQITTADFFFEVKRPGGVFRELYSVGCSNGFWSTEFDPYAIIPRNCDVRIRVEAADTGSVVFANMGFYLAKVVST